MSGAPGYWMDEASGELRPAILAYMRQATISGSPPMSDAHIAAMRDYLRQWIMAPLWRGPMIDVLRTKVGELTTFEEIERWMDMAEAQDIDPL